MAHYKGLIKIVHKDLPMEEIHPWAMHAAVDANCLADLNSKAYSAYVDFVHAHGPDITGARFEAAKSSWRSTISQIPSGRRIKSMRRNLVYA
jgi:hypothetical protein